MGLIRSSCNGLVLVSEPTGLKSKANKLCVKNPLTDPTFTLPNCPSPCKHKVYDCGSALGFDPLTKQYKVVHIKGNKRGFEIFTLGSDNNEWRSIPGRFVDDEEFECCDPETINGRFFYWFVESENHVISMDISNEKLIETKLPDIGKTISIGRYQLVDMNGKLSFVYNTSEFVIDVWVLNDFERQIWSKEHSIIAQSINFTTFKGNDQSKEKDKLPHLMNLSAFAALRNGEVIMFRHNKKLCNHDFVYLYDLKSKGMKKLKMRMEDEQWYIPHRSSLVSWKSEMDHHLSAKLSKIEL